MKPTFASRLTNMPSCSRLAALLFLCCTVSMVAQPPKRRAQQEEKEKKTQTTTQTKPGGSVYREFPAAQVMPDDAEWRRDVYREIDLTKDENAPLYYPVTPQGNKMSLFTYIFKLILRGQVPAYKYNNSDIENFSESNKVRIIDVMKDYDIYYEVKDKKMRINDADIPSREVKSYYVKESTYYDQHTATFHSRITALCPLLHRTDFDEEGNIYGDVSKYALFWVKYDDLAPYLGKLMFAYSTLNNAAEMSADDYFNQNLYKGDIYMTTNMQKKEIIRTRGLKSDSTVINKRNIIEKQLTDFEDHVWRGDTVATVPADSAAAATAAPKEEKKTRTSPSRRTTTASRRTSSNSGKQKTTKVRTGSASRSGSGYSVRRQRH